MGFKESSLKDPISAGRSTLSLLSFIFPLAQNGVEIAGPPTDVVDHMVTLKNINRKNKKKLVSQEYLPLLAVRRTEKCSM